jgi:PIN domain nuclease of toxin-antitoxin system
MKLLLDTHTLLWWLENPALLSKQARTAIRDGKNVVYLSAAVAWEIVIKKSLGKLDIPDNLEDVLQANRFLPLPVTIAHAIAVQSLPTYHRDPFDRMLIAQALCEGLTLVSRDSNIQKYPISCMVA